MGQQIREAAKAIYAALDASLGSLSAVLTGTTHLSQVTAGQLVIIVLAGLVAGGGVYGIPNGRKAPPVAPPPAAP